MRNGETHQAAKRKNFSATKVAIARGAGRIRMTMRECSGEATADANSIGLALGLVLLAASWAAAQTTPKVVFDKGAGSGPAAVLNAAMNQTKPDIPEAVSATPAPAAIAVGRETVAGSAGIGITVTPPWPEFAQVTVGSTFMQAGRRMGLADCKNGSAINWGNQSDQWTWTAEYRLGYLEGWHSCGKSDRLGPDKIAYYVETTVAPDASGDFIEGFLRGILAGQSRNQSLAGIELMGYNLGRRAYEYKFGFLYGAYLWDGTSGPEPNPGPNPDARDDRPQAQRFVELWAMSRHVGVEDRDIYSTDLFTQGILDGIYNSRPRSLYPDLGYRDEVRNVVHVDVNILDYKKGFYVGFLQNQTHGNGALFALEDDLPTLKRSRSYAMGYFVGFRETVNPSSTPDNHYDPDYDLVANEDAYMQGLKDGRLAAAQKYVAP